MRILFETLLRLIDAYKCQKLDGTCPGFFLILVCVKFDYFFYLVSNCIDRVERCHWVLEDDRYFVSSYLTELSFSHVIDAMTVEVDRSADESSRISGEAHKAVCRYGLAGSGLTYDTEHLAFLHFKGYIVECLYLACRCEEGKSFMLYVYQNFFILCVLCHDLSSFLVLQLRVEGVSETVAEQVEAQYDQRDNDRRYEEQMRECIDTIDGLTRKAAQ